MLPEVLAQPVNGKGVSLIRHAGTVVVDICASQNRDKGVIAQATLHNAFPDGHAADMPLLSPFHEVKLTEAASAVLSRLQPLPSLVHIDRGVGDVLLH